MEVPGINFNPRGLSTSECTKKQTNKKYYTRTTIFNINQIF